MVKLNLLLIVSSCIWIVCIINEVKGQLNGLILTSLLSGLRNIQARPPFGSRLIEDTPLTISLSTLSENTHKNKRKTTSNNLNKKASYLKVVKDGYHYDRPSISFDYDDGQITRKPHNYYSDNQNKNIKPIVPLSDDEKNIRDNKMKKPNISLDSSSDMKSNININTDYTLLKPDDNSERESIDLNPNVPTRDEVKIIGGYIYDPPTVPFEVEDFNLKQNNNMNEGEAVRVPNDNSVSQNENIKPMVPVSDDETSIRGNILKKPNILIESSSDMKPNNNIGTDYTLLKPDDNSESESMDLNPDVPTRNEVKIIGGYIYDPPTVPFGVEDLNLKQNNNMAEGEAARKPNDNSVSQKENIKPMVPVSDDETSIHGNILKKPNILIESSSDMKPNNNIGTDYTLLKPDDNSESESIDLSPDVPTRNEVKIIGGYIYDPPTVPFEVEDLNLKQNNNMTEGEAVRKPNDNSVSQNENIKPMVPVSDDETSIHGNILKKPNILIESSSDMKPNNNLGTDYTLLKPDDNSESESIDLNPDVPTRNEVKIIGGYIYDPPTVPFGVEDLNLKQNNNMTEGEAVRKPNDNSVSQNENIKPMVPVSDDETSIHGNILKKPNILIESSSDMKPNNNLGTDYTLLKPDDNSESESIDLNPDVPTRNEVKIIGGYIYDPPTVPFEVEDLNLKQNNNMNEGEAVRVPNDNSVSQNENIKPMVPVSDDETSIRGNILKKPNILIESSSDMKPNNNIGTDYTLLKPDDNSESESMDLNPDVPTRNEVKIIGGYIYDPPTVPFGVEDLNLKQNNNMAEGEAARKPNDNSVSQNENIKPMVPVSDDETSIHGNILKKPNILIESSSDMKPNKNIGTDYTRLKPDDNSESESIDLNPDVPTRDEVKIIGSYIYDPPTVPFGVEDLNLKQNNNMNEGEAVRKPNDNSVSQNENIKPMVPVSDDETSIHGNILKKPNILIESSSDMKPNNNIGTDYTLLKPDDNSESESIDLNPDVPTRDEVKIIGSYIYDPPTVPFGVEDLNLKQNNNMTEGEAVRKPNDNSVSQNENIKPMVPVSDDETSIHGNILKKPNILIESSSDMKPNNNLGTDYTLLKPDDNSESESIDLNPDVPTRDEVKIIGSYIYDPPTVPFGVEDLNLKQNNNMTEGEAVRKPNDNSVSQNENLKPMVPVSDNETSIHGNILKKPNILIESSSDMKPNNNIGTDYTLLKPDDNSESESIDLNPDVPTRDEVKIIGSYIYDPPTVPFGVEDLNLKQNNNMTEGEAVRKPNDNSVSQNENMKPMVPVSDDETSIHGNILKKPNILIESSSDMKPNNNIGTDYTLLKPDDNSESESIDLNPDVPTRDEVKIIGSYIYDPPTVPFGVEDLNLKQNNNMTEGEAVRKPNDNSVSQNENIKPMVPVSDDETSIHGNILKKPNILIESSSDMKPNNNIGTVYTLLKPDDNSESESIDLSPDVPTRDEVKIIGGIYDPPTVPFGVEDLNLKQNNNMTEGEAVRKPNDNSVSQNENIKPMVPVSDDETSIHGNILKKPNILIESSSDMKPNNNIGTVYTLLKPDDNSESESIDLNPDVPTRDEVKIIGGYIYDPPAVPFGVEDLNLKQNNNMTEGEAVRKPNDNSVSQSKNINPIVTVSDDETSIRGNILKKPNILIESSSDMKPNNNIGTDYTLLKPDDNSESESIDLNPDVPTRDEVKIIGGYIYDPPTVPFGVEDLNLKQNNNMTEGEAVRKPNDNSVSQNENIKPMVPVSDDETSIRGNILKKPNILIESSSDMKPNNNIGTDYTLLKPDDNSESESIDLNPDVPTRDEVKIIGGYIYDPPTVPFGVEDLNLKQNNNMTEGEAVRKPNDNSVSQNENIKPMVPVSDNETSIHGNILKKPNILIESSSDMKPNNNIGTDYTLLKPDDNSESESIDLNPDVPTRDEVKIIGSYIYDPPTVPFGVEDLNLKQNNNMTEGEAVRKPNDNSVSQNENIKPMVPVSDDETSIHGNILKKPNILIESSSDMKPNNNIGTVYTLLKPDDNSESESIDLNPDVPTRDEVKIIGGYIYDPPTVPFGVEDLNLKQNNNMTEGEAVRKPNDNSVSQNENIKPMVPVSDDETSIHGNILKKPNILIESSSDMKPNNNIGTVYTLLKPDDNSESESIDLNPDVPTRDEVKIIGGIYDPPTVPFGVEDLNLKQNNNMTEGEAVRKPNDNSVSQNENIKPMVPVSDDETSIHGNILKKPNILIESSSDMKPNNNIGTVYTLLKPDDNSESESIDLNPDVPTRDEVKIIGGYIYDPPAVPFGVEDLNLKQNNNMTEGEAVRKPNDNSVSQSKNINPIVTVSDDETSIRGNILKKPNILIESSSDMKPNNNIGTDYTLLKPDDNSESESIDLNPDVPTRDEVKIIGGYIYDPPTVPFGVEDLNLKQNNNMTEGEAVRKPNDNSVSQNENIKPMVPVSDDETSIRGNILKKPNILIESSSDMKPNNNIGTDELILKPDDNSESESLDLNPDVSTSDDEKVFGGYLYEQPIIAFNFEN